MSKPFAGVTVLDFSRVFAGPYAAEQLAFLGADVIKIEQPGGEETRFNSMNPALAQAGRSPNFAALNAGKRAITLDLKHPDATAVVHRLVACADVLIENSRPGAMHRMGFDYESLRAVNPRLIYCSISGFGQEGPDRAEPAYDGKIQATSGIMSITGHPASGPTRAGFAVVDTATGMSAAFAIAGALYQRMTTGSGQHIDVAMLDAALSFMAPTVSEHVNGGVHHELFGNMAVSGKPTADMFPVRDGNLQLSCNSEAQFQALCAEIGRPDLLADPRFADWPKRHENGAALRAEIERAFAEDDATAWERRLNKAGVPAARIRSIGEALAHPQLAYRDLLLDLPESTGATERITVLNAPFRFAHDGPGTDLPPPRLGEHTDAILREAGYDAAGIAALRASGAI